MAVAAAVGLVFVPAFASVVAADGYDVSWPQCGTALPADGDFRIVGVTGGKPYTENECLGDQYRWARGAPGGAAFYINTANPGAASQALDWYGQRAPLNTCNPNNEAACAFDYGYMGAAQAFAYAQRATGAAGKHSWWLDVEIANSWSPSQAVNVFSITGAVAFLQSQGVPVGLYSTGYQWGRITGGHRLNLPNWLAGALTAEQAASWCTPDASFSGGPVNLVQWEDGIDHNHACAPLPATRQGPAPASGNPNTLKILLEKLLHITLP